MIPTAFPQLRRGCNAKSNLQCVLLHVQLQSHASNWAHSHRESRFICCVLNTPRNQCTEFNHSLPQSFSLHLTIVCIFPIRQEKSLANCIRTENWLHSSANNFHRKTCYTRSLHNSHCCAEKVIWLVSHPCFCSSILMVLLHFLLVFSRFLFICI